MSEQSHAELIAHSTAENILNSEFVTDPDYLRIIRERIIRREELNERNYLAAINADLKNLPSVKEFGGGGGEVCFGDHHFIYVCNKKRTAVPARPHDLRILIDREGVQDTEHFSLERTEVHDVLGRRDTVIIQIKHQQGTGTPQEFCVLYEKFREAVEQAMERRH